MKKMTAILKKTVAQKSDVENTSEVENQNFSTQEKAVEIAELWEEDELAVEEINAQIIKAQENSEWGTISGKLQQMIEASLIVKMDYKKMLSSFRANIPSQNRELTRTRPNRRYGFEFMGSRYKFTTKFLIAVDVRGFKANYTSQNFMGAEKGKNI